jgi:hypothetical protein
MEKLPFVIHGKAITDQTAAANVAAEHRLLISVSLASFGELVVDYVETGLVVKLRAPLEKLQRQLREGE